MLWAQPRIWTLCLLLAATTACDVLVKDGETVVLGNGSKFFGADTPNAAFVLPEGKLVVDNAELTGRGKVVSSLPPGAFPTPGAGIVATAGVVEIRNGRVNGGNVVISLGDPAALPRVSIPGPNQLAPALIAASSDVAISGGILTSSAVISDSLNPYTFAPAMIVAGGSLLISGGSFQSGTAGIPFATVVEASRAGIAISGGSFAGLVEISSSNTLVSGGNFSIGLLLGTSLARAIPAPPGCTEILGGNFGFGVDVRGEGEQLFIFGNDFDRGFGPLPIGPAPGAPQSFTVTGTRLDDSRFTLSLFVQAGTRVVLASPDDSGCGF